MEIRKGNQPLLTTLKVYGVHWLAPAGFLAKPPIVRFDTLVSNQSAGHDVRSAPVDRRRRLID